MRHLTEMGWDLVGLEVVSVVLVVAVRLAGGLADPVLSCPILFSFVLWV